MVERREFRRHRVGGNVEFTSVHGSGSVPGERATVVDCSLGGARLRVPSPRRRLFKALPPCLSPHDSVTCVLRLAPDYQDIEIFAEVVRVARRDDAPDDLDVGLRFFHDVGRRSHAERPMARLARIIEPDWSAEQRAAILLAAEARPSRRAPTVVESSPKAEVNEVEPKAAESTRTSRRAPAATPDDGSRASRRAPQVRAAGEATGEAARPSRRAAAPSAPPAEAAPAGRSGRHGQRLSRQPQPEVEDAPAPRASQRVARPAAIAPDIAPKADDAPRASQRVARPATSVRPAEDPRASRRLARAAEGEARVSGRLAGVRHEAAPPPRRVAESDDEVVAWASSRLAAAVAAPATERVATADDEVTVRGSARLVAGEAVIELPGAFTARAREAGLTAHVTPTADCAGLYVAERSPARLVVRELGGGRGAASFDYLVVATRRA